MVEAAMTSGAPREWRRLPTIIILAALSAIVLLTHGAAAYYAYSFYDAGKTIFVGEVTPTASTAPNGSGRPDRATPDRPLRPTTASISRGHHWKRRPPPGGSTSCSLASIWETAAITR